MKYFYELINRHEGRFVNTFIHSIDKVEMHWHNEMEILLVLEGSVNIRIDNRLYLLKENDLILINANEIHNIFNTQQDNILLAVQINLKNLHFYYPKVGQKVFDCNSFLHGKEEQERFDVIRYYLAEIVWAINKDKKGYEFTVGSYISLLVEYLINNFHYSIIEDEEAGEFSKEIERLQNIVSYINEHLESRVTLQEIAHKEELSISYLSRFIKEKLGMNFQQYVNTLRMDRAVSLLLSTNQTITDIAYASGFPSSKSFYRLFKETRGCTPTEFREENAHIKGADRQANDERMIGTYLDVDRTTALKKLFSYLTLEKAKGIGAKAEETVKEAIVVDGQGMGTPYIRHWQKLTTFSRAAEGMRHNWRLQLQELQGEIGFEYIRFLNIFGDEMMICNMDETGQIIYNWSYVDELFDYLIKMRLKPFINLGFMPSELKSSDETVFWWRANISRPKDIKLWNDLVGALIKHCMNRYGRQEVESWYFEVWNEPDFEYSFWIGNRQDYFEFYRETAHAIKSVSASLKVGGPAVAQQVATKDAWLREFISYCKENSVPLDFVSLHIYPEIYDAKEISDFLGEKINAGASVEEIVQEVMGIKRIYNGKNNTCEVIKTSNRIVEQALPYMPEVHVTEWNASSLNRNLIHDTCFVAAYIVSNVIECLGEVDFLGYWNFTDIQEEFKAGISAFHGGFGLINKDGLKKPSYYAYYLLGKLGENVIDRGQDYIITRTGEDIQMLFCNYIYFDNLFLNGDTSALTHKERYLIYEDKLAKEISVSITDLVGPYKVTRYELNRDHGSVFDKWLEMGAPEDMTPEETNYLQGISRPKMDVAYMDIDEDYRETVRVPVHGVGLITLEKQI